jgi:hypothetical protein
MNLEKTIDASVKVQVVESFFGGLVGLSQGNFFFPHFLVLSIKEGRSTVIIFWSQTALLIDMLLFRL